MPPFKFVLRNAAVGLLALALSGCDLSDCCLFHKKKESTNWAAVNQARFGSAGGAGGAGGASGGGGGGGGGTGGSGRGGGNAVPEISPSAAVAGLTLLGGFALILADCRRPRRHPSCAVPS
jgi:hypothetical protein